MLRKLDGYPFSNQTNHFHSRLLCCFWELPLLWPILAMEDMAMVTEAMVMVVMEVMVEDIMEKEMLMQRL